MFENMFIQTRRWIYTIIQLDRLTCYMFNMLVLKEHGEPHNIMEQIIIIVVIITAIIIISFLPQFPNR